MNWHLEKRFTVTVMYEIESGTQDILLTTKGKHVFQEKLSLLENLTFMMGRLVSLATANISLQNYVLQDVIVYRLL
jgi:hypothetical protein